MSLWKYGSAVPNDVRWSHSRKSRHLPEAEIPAKTPMTTLMPTSSRRRIGVTTSR